MGALSATRESATLLAFPGAAREISTGVIAAALRRHRVPEDLAAQLLRASAGIGDPEAALTRALSPRMMVEALDLEAAHSILLIGASGAGKSQVAAAIARAAGLGQGGRQTVLLSAQDGLAQLRAGTLERQKLTLMEAEGFHPLNPKARGAFAALSDIEGVLAVGVISASGDAEDAAEMVTGFRFRRIIVTGLDRTRRLGALTAAVTAGARLAHVLKKGALETLYPGDLAASLLA
jgi:hypothetical protein